MAVTKAALVLLLLVLGWAGEGRAQLEVVGLYVNHRAEERTLDVEMQAGRYLLALDDLIGLGRVAPTETAQGYLFDTPLGRTTLRRERVREIGSRRYVGFDDLSTIGVRARFLRQYYAVALEIPWLPFIDTADEETPADRAEPRIDFPGPRLGLSAVSLLYRYDHDLDGGGDSAATLSGFGPLSKGKWGLEIDYEPESADEATVSSLFWDRYQGRHAVRLGSAVSRIGSGISGLGYTGLQYAYSNKGIARHLHDSNTFTGSMLTSNSNYTQDIRGFGPPLGIAELRVDDRIVGRLQIGFDGRYEFLNLNLGASFNRKIEIHIYEYTHTGRPVEVIDISKLRKPEGVSTGELFFQGGGGGARATRSTTASAPMTNTVISTSSTASTTP